MFVTNSQQKDPRLQVRHRRVAWPAASCAIHTSVSHHCNRKKKERMKVCQDNRQGKNEDLQRQEEEKRTIRQMKTRGNDKEQKKMREGEKERRATKQAKKRLRQRGQRRNRNPQKEEEKREPHMGRMEEKQEQIGETIDSLLPFFLLFLSFSLSLSLFPWLTRFGEKRAAIEQT